MRARVMVVATALLVLATMGPTTQAGDAFWHGTNISDSGVDGLLDYAEHLNIHKALVDAMPASFIGDNGIMRMPPGDIITIPEQRGVRIHKHRKCWSGYTLLNPMTSTGTDVDGTVVLVDMKGNIVNEWAFPPIGFVGAADRSGKMLPGGHVVGSTQKGGLTQLDWHGNVVRQWDDPIFTNVHHDHQREGSPCGYFAPYQKPKTYGGKVLTLEYFAPSMADTAHISTKLPLLDDLIREVSWDGEKVLFEWYAWEHFWDLGLDKAARNAIKKGINDLGGVEDWAHANDVAWLGPNKWWSQHHDCRFDPRNIIADFRSLNITIIIARHKHPYGKWDQGEIVWQLGPDYSTAGDDGKVGQIIGQHMAHMIPMYLPGEGNILMFDNGGGAGYGALIQGLKDPDTGEELGYWPNKFRNFSRVLEINPMTKQIEWEYKQPKPSKDCNKDGKILGNERLFYSNIMSGAQRLLNGNTLITEADTGRIFEVTRKGDVCWEYAPSWVQVPPVLEGNFAAIMMGGVYRAYRIPYWWVPRHLLRGKKCWK